MAYVVHSFQNNLGLLNTSGSMNNTIFTCEFTKEITVAVEPKIFDLMDSYFLLLARGSVSSGKS